MPAWWEDYDPAIDDDRDDTENNDDPFRYPDPADEQHTDTDEDGVVA